MKSLFRILLIILVSINTCYSTTVIKIVTDAYYPYVISDNDEATGVFPDIVKAIFNAQNIQYKIELQPWARCQRNLENGSVFGTFPYLKTNERDEKFLFSEPVIKFYPKFLYLKERFKKEFNWNKLSDLLPYTIGGVRGYWYEKRFKKQMLRVDYAANNKRNIEKVLRKRVDFTIVDELVGRHIINSHFSSEASRFAFTDRPESIPPLRIMVSRSAPNSRSILSKLNEGLEKIKKNGVYRAILKKHKIPKGYSVE